MQPDPAVEDVTYSYDAANRITGGSDGSTFTHDDAGRLTGQTINGQTSTFAYNALDVLTSLNSPSISDSYTYNAMNQRVQRAKNGTTTKHLWNPVGSLPNLTVDLDGSDNPQRFYVYGQGLINQIDASNNVRYHHYDYTGNTLALTDGSGATTDTYAYTPYGETFASGSSYNAFRFNGRYGVTDDGTGLIHMRARYYAPKFGRFVSLDTKNLRQFGDAGSNRYAFATSNPISMVDPAGLSGEAAYLLANGVGLTPAMVEALRAVVPQDGKRDRIGTAAAHGSVRTFQSKGGKKYEVNGCGPEGNGLWATTISYVLDAVTFNDIACDLHDMGYADQALQTKEVADLSLTFNMERINAEDIRKTAQKNNANILWQLLPGYSQYQAIYLVGYAALHAPSNIYGEVLAVEGNVVPFFSSDAFAAEGHRSKGDAMSFSARSVRDGFKSAKRTAKSTAHNAINAIGYFVDMNTRPELYWALWSHR